MSTNHLMLTNETGTDRVYHIAKPETLNVPISRLTVNGNDFPYELEGDVLRIDVMVPANMILEIIIEYDTEPAVASLLGSNSEAAN
jgi:hypothetical protein